MSASAQLVSAELELRLVVSEDSTLTVPAVLGYDPSDPYAVSVAFHTGTEEVVEWTFARSLLTDGVNGPVGDGDVRVWPSQERARRRGDRATSICLSLSSPSGRALFQAPLAGLVEFLGRTYERVPTGREGEFLDVDAELSVLLDLEP